MVTSRVLPSSLAVLLLSLNPVPSRLPSPFPFSPFPLQERDSYSKSMCRLLERSVFSDRMVFVRAVHKSKFINDTEVSGGTWVTGSTQLSGSTWVLLFTSSARSTTAVINVYRQNTRRGLCQSCVMPALVRIAPRTSRQPISSNCIFLLGIPPSLPPHFLTLPHSPPL